jgi:hypothetical protein
MPPTKTVFCTGVARCRAIIMGVPRNPQTRTLPNHSRLAYCSLEHRLFSSLSRWLSEVYGFRQSEFSIRI